MSVRQETGKGISLSGWSAHDLIMISIIGWAYYREMLCSDGAMRLRAMRVLLCHKIQPQASSPAKVFRAIFAV